MRQEVPMKQASALDAVNDPQLAREADAVRVRGLHMRFGAIEAVRGIDFVVRHGEILACLGPNGAGKTTTIEILEGFQRRTDGKVQVLGEDPEIAGGQWRSRIGVVLQESQPEADLTVSECLSLYAGYYPRPRPVGETLELVGLSSQSRARSAQLSGGQRRRLDVALALIGDPQLIFLDEPTTGFDPAARRSSWDVIAGLRALGKTVVLTTHYMDEAEHLADRIMVMSKGEIIATGTPADLGGRADAPSTISFSLPQGYHEADLPVPLRSKVASAPAPQVQLRSNDSLADLALLAQWAGARGVGLPDLQVTRPSLEDIYLDLVEAV
jgi:ABC-2 type transport system ATP-binding protein